MGRNLLTFPDSIVKLTALKYLYLSNNQIVEIPVEIGKLTALEDLYLSNNQIVKIPVEIGKLTALKSFDLSENNISCVPMDFAQKLYDAGNLRFFDLRNNPLNEYGEGVNNLGWRDLKNMFGDRIIIDQDTQNV